MITQMLTFLGSYNFCGFFHILCYPLSTLRTFTAHYSRKFKAYVYGIIFQMAPQFRLFSSQNIYLISSRLEIFFALKGIIPPLMGIIFRNVKTKWNLI